MTTSNKRLTFTLLSLCLLLLLLLIFQNTSLNLSLSYFSYFTEKYIFYLPHSGFVNQLIELENALLIAFLTNRTLILPPFYVGFLEIPFCGFDKQVRNLEDADSFGGYNKCIRNGFEANRHLINFDSIFSRDALRELGMKVIGIPEFLELNFFDYYYFGVDIFKEVNRYGFRYVEDIENGNEQFLVDNVSNDIEEKGHVNSTLFSLKCLVASKGETRVLESECKDVARLDNASYTDYGPFKHIVNLKTLHKLSELVIFTSTFHQDRVSLVSEKSKDVFEKIKNSLMYSNPLLLKVANNIVKQLGEYIGVHARGSDGHFKDTLFQTVYNISGILKNNSCPSLNNSSKCIKNPIKLYVATDVDVNLVKTILLENLPYAEVFFLHDFINELYPLSSLQSEIITDGQGTTTQLLEKFIAYPKNTKTSIRGRRSNRKCRNNHSNINSNLSLWFPFIDQIVAAKGYGFLGTDGSSFSDRIMQFHGVYRRDPWVINST